MAEKNNPQNERPKLMAKRPELRIRMRITDVEGKKHKDLPIQGVELRLDFDEVHAMKENLELWFNYAAVYQPDIGHIRMSGVILAEVGVQVASEQAKLWESTKQIDQVLANKLLSSVNYRCGTESIFVGKLVDLPSPVVPPPVNLGLENAEQQAGQMPPVERKRPAAAAAPQAQPSQQQPRQPAAAAPVPQPEEKKPAMPQRAAMPPAPPSQNVPLPGQQPNAAPGQQGPRRIDYISPFTGRKPS